MWSNSKQISILSENLGKIVFIEKQILFGVKRNEETFDWTQESVFIQNKGS